ncbi:nucleoside/nucleotide kinase family protein [Metaplanococcus flavidus]|uniref:Uridine kinase n=1 Tax=Metaplanococcus flavidus TaxID=569883 RepID=A0ABW3L7P4_9BACL
MESIAAPFVIAIASVSGGGKTTAVESLTQVLPNAKALYFDQYDFAGPEDMMQWLDKGADPNEWDLTPLLAELKLLLAEPLDYIILDFPFAYQQAQSCRYIDFTVFIDTPLDLALSRRLMRDFSGAAGDRILEDVRYYARSGREAYLHMLSTIKPDSDAVIDGNQTVLDIVHSIAEKSKLFRNRGITNESSFS